jgi:UDP-N-acetylglucosamine transferase subunit ALG13
MITITLGTIPYPFNRAVTWLSILLKRDIISEPVFIQYGASDISVVAKHPLVTATPILQSYELMKMVDDSRLVISHAGQGSTRALAKRGACFVLLPRLRRYGEHIDDHQLSFAQSVEKFGISYCLSLEELEPFILQPPPPFQNPLFDGPKLADHLLKVYPESTGSSNGSCVSSDWWN